MNTLKYFKSWFYLFVVCACLLAACSPAKSLMGGADAPAAAESLSGGAAPAAMPASADGVTQTVQTLPSGVLTAGDVDDHLNFPFFLNYLSNAREGVSSLPALALKDRVTLHFYGDDRRPLSQAWVRLTPQGAEAPAITRLAGTDGRFEFFPEVDGAGAATVFTLQVGLAGQSDPLLTTSLDLQTLDETRSLSFDLPGVRPELPPAMDLMFVIDTTGSMADELSYLTTEFRAIVAAIQDKAPGVDMRFGLVVYRDQGDDYVVRSFDFTPAAETMRKRLGDQVASGGGDYPEAVDAALAQALKAEWRSGNVLRLLFHVADAPPHEQNYQAALDQALLARQQGIRIYPLAASGVADEAEYIMRLAAALTQGRYLFLTDDSGVGNQHAEPKIPCYVVTRLDQLIIRVVLSELSGVRIEPEADQVLRSVGLYHAGVCEQK
jgi:hypothetical protein